MSNRLQNLRRMFSACMASSFLYRGLRRAFWLNCSGCASEISAPMRPGDSRSSGTRAEIGARKLICNPFSLCIEIGENVFLRGSRMNEPIRPTHAGFDGTRSRAVFHGTIPIESVLPVTRCLWTWRTAKSTIAWLQDTRWPTA